MFKLTEAAVCEAAPPRDAPCTSCGQCLQRSQGVGHPWGMPSDTHTFSSDWWTCEEASCRSKWCSEGCNCISFSPYYLHPETEVPTHHSPWEQIPNTTQAGRQLTAQGLQLLVLFLKKDKYFISTWKLVLLTRSRSLLLACWDRILAGQRGTCPIIKHWPNCSNGTSISLLESECVKESEKEGTILTASSVLFSILRFQSSFLALSLEGLRKTLCLTNRFLWTLCTLQKIANRTKVTLLATTRALRSNSPASAQGAKELH